MRGNETFDDLAPGGPATDRKEVDDAASTVVAGDEVPAAPINLTATIGRTVLPRIERDGKIVRIVKDDKERYATTKKIGEGGMGEVRLANDQDIGRPVAIKRLHPQFRGGGLSRFVAEIHTVGGLEHPNIIPIHDVGVDADGSYFFVMKFVEGETVEDILTRLKSGDPEARRVYTIERRLEIVRGVLHALEYAHARGVIHRDVKPANVMVGLSGEVVLMDWGIARNMGSVELETPDGAEASAPTSATQTRQGTVMGTPAYMSPEQFRGEIDKIDGRSDIYSLGVMLFELISLKNPSATATDLEAVKTAVLSRKSAADGVILEPGAGMNLYWLAHRATLTDRDKRLSSARAMLDELDRIAEGRGRVDCPFTALQRVTGETKRFVDHHPFVSLGAAMTAAGTLAAAAVGAAVAIAVLAIT